MMSNSSNNSKKSSSKNSYGGDFVVSSVVSHQIFTPEQFSAEHHELRKTSYNFSKEVVEPLAERLDKKEPGLMQKIMKQAADLGLFMMEIPETYEGLDLDKASSMIIAESLALVGSFAVTHGAHTGIGTLPIVYYGTDLQKKKYLPKLATGQYMAAYALSEQGSGSDALGAKTVAKLSADGKHYILNGTKAWITNAGWADLFTVFAQIDGNKFTAFLVERNYPGLSIGKEEHKLGIRGSSTCLLILQDVHVPVENVLGEIGRGHKIAFNILNIGRYKLGMGSIGEAKAALGYGIAYSQERKQFGKTISNFGLIRQKIATAATQIYAGESMAYRLAGDLDNKNSMLNKKDPEYHQKAIAVIDDYTIEASILKVYGSEVLYSIVDEMLQIHGGNGYTEDYPLERMQRDARINRIFEGTNEINRLIIPATLFKRALTGKLPLIDFNQQILALLNKPETEIKKKMTGPLSDEIHTVELTKKAVVFAASYAAQKYMEDLKEKQQLLGPLADCLIDIYAMDSVIARASQAEGTVSANLLPLHQALVKVACFDARARVFQHLRRIGMMMTEGSEEQDLFYDNLRKLDQRYRLDYMYLQDFIAQEFLAMGGYYLI